MVPARSRLQRESLSTTSAVLDAHQAESETGKAGPQPPEVAGFAQWADERQQREESDEPDGRADGDSTHAIDIERLDLGHGVASLADLDLADLGTTELVALCDPLPTGALAVAQLLVGLMVGVTHIRKATADG